MKKFLLVSCLFLQMVLHAQTITIDLSKNINQIFTQTITPQKINKIIFLNVLASRNYEISAKVRDLPAVPLSIPTNSKSLTKGGKGGPCDALDKAKDTLANETSESRIVKDILALKDEIKKANDSNCHADIIASLKLIDSCSSYEYPLPLEITIAQGQALDITISRNKFTWAYKFETAQKNHWTTYYGFTYVPDILNKFPNYYAKQQDNGSFLVSKMNGNNRNVYQNISPTAMFTYKFFKNPDAVVKFGLTGGIMYNTDILGAMFGPSLVIGDNITINTGVSFIQKYKLKGQYTEGQPVKENLDFDQLHNRVWSNDLFFSIGFNLPELFAKKSDKGTPAASTTTAAP